MSSLGKYVPFSYNVRLSSIAYWKQSVSNLESRQQERSQTCLAEMREERGYHRKGMCRRRVNHCRSLSLSGHGDYFTTLGIFCAKAGFLTRPTPSRGPGLRGGRRFRPALLA